MYLLHLGEGILAAALVGFLSMVGWDGIVSGGRNKIQSNNS